MNYAQKPTGDIGKAMTYKQEGIEKAQRSTQDSIRVSGSATDATLIIAALIPYWEKNGELTGLDIQAKWEYWRRYFFEKRDINNTFKELTDPLK